MVGILDIAGDIIQALRVQQAELTAVSGSLIPCQLPYKICKSEKLLFPTSFYPGVARQHSASH